MIGSVRQKTDAFGTLVHEDVRAPYGSTLLGWQYQNGPAFTGHMEDGATGLTYMKARYYDPVAMRFLSPDPVYVDLGTGGNFNRYWYANNNPYTYTYTDPDGRQAQTGTRIDRNRILEKVLRTIPLAPVPPPPPSTAPNNDPTTTYPADSPQRSDTESIRPERPDSERGRPTRDDYTGRPERPRPYYNGPSDSQPDERGLTKVKEREGNKVAQDHGYEDAHEAKDGRGNGGVDIYRDRRGSYWLWNGVPGGEKESL